MTYSKSLNYSFFYIHLQMDKITFNRIQIKLNIEVKIKVNFFSDYLLYHNNSIERDNY